MKSIVTTGVALSLGLVLTLKGGTRVVGISVPFFNHTSLLRIQNCFGEMLMK